MRDDADFKEVMARARQGDAAAHEALIRRILPWLTREARQRRRGVIRDHAQTEDAVQEALRRLLSVRRTLDFEDERAFRAYVLKALKSALLREAEKLRRDRRDVARERPMRTGFDATSDGRTARSPSPASQVADEEEAERLRGIMEKLSEEEQRLLMLRHELGLKWREIGERLGKEPDALRKQCRQILLRIKRSMQRRGGEES